MKGKKTTILTLLIMSLSTTVLAQGAADCRDFIVVCGSRQLALNSNGTGSDDFANPNNQRPDCGFSESQSLWLKVPIATDGSLEFVISPNNTSDDFDFAVYGPNVTCTNLGPSIRCSSTHPPSAGVPPQTGLRSGENENSDGPGANGNGFVDPLQVKAGEEYIILIDNFSQTNAGFQLNWGGTADIFSPPVANNPGDLEFCDPDGDGELSIDLSVYDDQIIGGQEGLGVRYFLSEEDALLGENALVSRDVLIQNSPQRIYAAVTVGESGCSSLTFFDVVLNAAPAVEEITGPQSVCPTVEGVPYTGRATNLDTYEWIVEGGDVASGQGTSDITVNWGLANDDAVIKLVGKTITGCISDTLSFPVKINKRLEPEFPQGADVVCFEDRLSVRYSVPQVPGSVYEWTAENGQIIGANDQNEIEVRWDAGATTGKVYFKEFNPSITECEGFSDTLNVQLMDEIVVTASVKDLLCPGESNGEITIAVSGGAVGAVDIVWDDTSTITDKREGLSAGAYTYTVTDSQGCVATGSVIVSEPEPLDFTEFMPLDATCFEKSNGGVSLQVSGGTGALSYQIGEQGAENALLSGAVSTAVLDIQTLGRGTYWVTITDENNCQLTRTFDVSSPELLEPDLESLMVKLACPGQTDGAIDLNAMGGTPDYQFIWTPNTGTQTAGSIEDIGMGEYTVRIVDMNGCETSLNVTVDEVLPRVVIPNAFSPNGDGKNDAYAPVANCLLSNYQFRIFNRWGNMVFASDNQNQGWRGSVDGQPAPDGKYSYKLVYRIMVNGQLIEESFQGVFRIFR